MRELNDREKWFRERIGARVYRNRDGCDCPSCEEVYQNGIRIADHYHAMYLYDMESCFTAEGSPLRYFDTKEEVAQFEKSIPHKL